MTATLRQALIGMAGAAFGIAAMGCGGAPPEPEATESAATAGGESTCGSKAGEATCSSDATKKEAPKNEASGGQQSCGSASCGSR